MLHQRSSITAQTSIGLHEYMQAERHHAADGPRAASPQRGKVVYIILSLFALAAMTFSAGYWLHWALDDSQHLVTEHQHIVTKWRVELAQAESHIKVAESKAVQAETMAQHEGPAAQKRALAHLDALRDAAIIAESHRDDAVKTQLKLQVETDTLSRQLFAVQKSLAACDCSSVSADASLLEGADKSPGRATAEGGEADENPKEALRPNPKGTLGSVTGTLAPHHARTPFLPPRSPMTAQCGLGWLAWDCSDTGGEAELEDLPPASCTDLHDNCEALQKRCFDGKHPPSFHNVDCCRTCWPLRPRTEGGLT
jgi:hypothetical protein